MASEPAFAAPPLPHLVGTPPTPRFVKRAYAALVLSSAAWVVFVFSFYLFAKMNAKIKTPVIVPLFNWRTDLEDIAGIALLISGLFGLVGTILGLSGRKALVGKIASGLGGLQFALWLLLVVVAVVIALRD